VHVIEQPAGTLSWRVSIALQDAGLYTVRREFDFSEAAGRRADKPL